MKVDIEENEVENIEQFRENKNNKKKKKGKVLRKIIIIFLILIILGCSCLEFLLYGPYKGFRDWLITTAMTTMTHQWIAEIFYDEETINSVLNSNRVDEVKEETKTEDIETELVIVEKTEEKEYKNEYEKQILEKDSENDAYKIINIEGKGYSGYLAAIYDPSKIHTLVTGKLGKSGQYLTTMAKNSKASIAINGGGFDDPGYNSNGANPLGITYANGKLITSYEYDNSGGMIGFNTDDVLVLSSNCSVSNAQKLNIRDCVCCGPFLIVNGKASTVVGNGGWGTAPRTAIGQRQDGIVLFLVIDGRTVKRPGADMDDLIEIMQNYGAYNAANLDGGTSSVMVVNGEMINDPIDSTGAHKTRFIATGFGLIDE